MTFMLGKCTLSVVGYASTPLMYQRDEIREAVRDPAVENSKLDVVLGFCGWLS